MMEQEQHNLRATRFPLSMSLRYREVGDSIWHVGKVENISRTGILFTVENHLGVSSQVEMAFELPIKLARGVPGQVQCEGQIVRTVMPAATDRPPSVAAQIKHYKLMPAAQ